MKDTRKLSTWHAVCGALHRDAATMSLIFMRLGLMRASSATLAVLFATIIVQLPAAVGHGCYYAGSAEFMGKPIVEVLVWMHLPDGVIFSVGALALAWFVIRLWIAPTPEPATGGHSVNRY